ncbi:MAG: thioredoxin domain-containing protein [Austwickia sp.]|nr:thioredoxin domain-containing protein [Austwickia sp.]MBK9101002.1 thioredoxin domain-containing protein [Austwickia sp.]
MTSRTPRRTTAVTTLVLGAALLTGCATMPSAPSAASTSATKAPATGSAGTSSASPIGSAAATASSSPTGTRGTTGHGMALPKGVTDPAAGLVVNAGTAAASAPTLEVYEDFQCPSCATVHASLGPTIKELAAAGKVRLVFHPMVFLDDKIGNDASKRVTNAAACAADAGAYLAYHHAAMSNQSSEGKGFSAEQIQQFARDAGLSGAALTTWQACEAAGTYRAYVLASEQTALASGVNGTPTFKVNGRELELNTLTPESLSKAVTDATQ